MATLINNIPPVKVWIRREYLRDMRDGHGEYELGYWVSIKTIPGRAMYFETYLPEYAAMFDKLPISAFLIWDPDHPHEPKKPDPDLPLEELSFWNAFSYDNTILEKNLPSTMRWEARTKTHGVIPGEYLLTVDCYDGDRSRPDLTFSETPDEHKSANILVLENGQIAPEQLKNPDFLVSTRYFNVEYPNAKWGRLGESEEYFWETETEKNKYKPFVPHDEEFDR